MIKPLDMTSEVINTAVEHFSKAKLDVPTIGGFDAAIDAHMVMYATPADRGDASNHSLP